MPGITNPAEAYFKDGTWSWDGTLWRKQPLMLGYSDRIYEWVSTVSSGAADTQAISAVVPAGEIWIIQAASAMHTDTTARALYLGPRAGATFIQLGRNPAATTLLMLQCVSPMVLKEGDSFLSGVSQLLTGKVVYLGYWGYKMSIAE